MPVTFSENATIESISIYHHGGTGNVLMGVYSDQTGSPTSRLGVTASTAINSTEGWQNVSLTNPVTVTSGQTVWLSWVFQNSTGVRFTGGAPARAVSTATWAGGMPATFGTATFGDFKYSIYCTYTLNTTILKDAAIPEDIKDEQVKILYIENNINVKNNLSDENSINPLETNDFNLYPNPAKSFLNVDYLNLPERETRLFIIDGSGRVILNRLVQSTMNRIDISNFPSGLYYIKSVNQQWNKTKKLIITK
jgi:hypothetical protein